MPHGTDTVSMKSSPKERKEATESHEFKEPEYPHGLVIHLGSDELEKLGVKELPKLGKELSLYAKVTVKSASMSDDEQHGQSKSVGLQITDLAIMDAEKLKSSDKEIGSALYGGK